MRKLIVIILSNFFCCGCIVAQTSVTGLVIEAGTGKPLAAATVFLSNTSTGGATNDKGVFNLKKIPSEKFTLVVSCIGYESFAKEFQPSAASDNIIIELKRKAAELDEIVITPAEKNGWLSWGDLFTEHFIGDSYYGRNCRIRNPKVLKFRKNEKDNLLTVTANEPLVIENRTLGYTIKYDLNEFRYDFTTNIVSYAGHALFEETISNDGKAALKYKEERQKVYAISLVHFMRSLYNETTEAEGFRILRKTGKGAVEIRKGIAPLKAEYDGVENFDTVYEISNTKTEIKIIASKSKDENRSNFNDTDRSSIGNIISIADGNVLLNFTDTLQVVYTNSTPPFEYAKYAAGNYKANLILSEIMLSRPGAITIMPNGSFSPGNLAMNGFWGWWEKISIMLPYDYNRNE